jgi:general nucleoside transport system permease protein
MSSATTTMTQPGVPRKSPFARLMSAMGMPLLALFTAFLMGALVIFFTNWLTTHSVADSLNVVVEAYVGLFRGAFTKERGFSETLVATVPYILLSLGLAIGFKSGLFNIGVEGQFYIGAIAASWFGQLTHALPAIIHLPLTLFIGALGGAIWAAIPGYLKAKTGAHEVINTIMMNYIAFRLTEYLISGPVKDKVSTATQTPSVSASAQVWTMYEIPERLKNPLNALMVAILLAIIAMLLVRWILGTKKLRQRFTNKTTRRLIIVGSGLVFGVLTFFLLPLLTQAWWPFKDQYDRLHTGMLIALAMVVVVWWLMWRTTLGFELRTAGANPNAARYAGVNVTRNIVLAMAFSGALAGLAGTIEVVAVSTCRCMQLFFSSGYGFDSIAVALLAKNNPFGIVLSSLLFGAMRNGADLMELNSGVSKYIISLVQALALLFVAAPGMVRWIYRMKEPKVTEVEAPLTRGWGG